MPDIPRFSAFDVTSKLQQELDFSRTAGTGDPLAGTGASVPSSIRVQTVTQSPNGFWSEVISDQPSPVQTQDSIISSLEQQRVGLISSFEEICAAYDREILSLNNQINDKKSVIVSKVTSAVSGFCGFEGTLPSSPGAEDINGVSVGIGVTVRGDTSAIKIYPNIRAYTADSPFNDATTQNLSNSNVGLGYENVMSINSGSIIGSYGFVSTDPNVHCLCTSIIDPTPHLCIEQGKTVTDQATCAGYGSSIITIASEILTLRNERDQYLDQINRLKREKNKKEIQNWGSKQSETTLQQHNNALEQAIVDLSAFVDPLVMNGLIVYYDAAENYGIGTTVDIYTGISSVTAWNNLKGDGLYASPRTSLYSINLDDSDGPSVELNNYSIVTNQYFTVPSSYIASNKIGTGNTSYTLEAWFKVTNDVALGISSTTNGATIVGINSVHGYGLQVYKPSGVRVSFGERGNGGLTNSTNLDLDSWYHVAAVNEAGVGSRIYINGSLDGSGSAINITSTVSDLRVGFTSSQITQYFSGKISAVRIYNRNLTQAEVTQNFEVHKARYGFSTTA